MPRFLKLHAILPLCKLPRNLAILTLAAAKRPRHAPPASTRAFRLRECRHLHVKRFKRITHWRRYAPTPIKQSKPPLEAVTPLKAAISAPHVYEAPFAKPTMPVAS